MALLGAKLTGQQVGMLVTSALLVLVTGALLSRTRVGLKMRAVADDPELAEVGGINSDHAVVWAFGIGSALAGTAGVLAALDVDIKPTMGMNALMMAVVVSVVGGMQSTAGMAMGALFLGLAQQFGVLYIGAEWQDAIAFAVLAVFLVLRPRGVLGREVRSGQV